MKKEDDWKIGLRCNATGCMDAATTDDGFCLLHGAQTAGTSAQQPTERNTAMHGNTGDVIKQGATMTAAELIELLKAHPKACKAMGLKLDIGNRWTSASDGNGVWFSDMDTTCWEGKPDYQTPRFRRWLLGAAQECADGMGIGVSICEDLANGAKLWYRTIHTYDDTRPVYPTRLHALLAVIEATA